MNREISFSPFACKDRDTCLALFDANCPEYFAPNERADYVVFLESEPSGYTLCLIDGEVCGAFGLIGSDASRRRLNWIMLDPRFQGVGAGRAIMERVALDATAEGVQTVEIAASHKSAPFFAKFGAITRKVIEEGWGPGMHRVDMELPVLR